MELRNATFNADGTINVEVNHPVYGWLPFTASQDDVEATGREIYAEALAGSVAPYTPPPAPTPEEARAAMPALSPRVLRLTLLSINITEADVDAALASNPSGMIEWKYATYFKRTHPLIAALIPSFSLTEEQVDSLWLYAADIT